MSSFIKNLFKFNLPINYDASFGKHKFSQPFTNSQQKYAASTLKANYLNLYNSFLLNSCQKTEGFFNLLLPIFDTVFYPQYFLHTTIDIWRFWTCTHSFSCLRYVIEAERLTVSACSDLVLSRYTRLALLRSIQRRDVLKSKRWLLSGDWNDFVFGRIPVILLI